MNEKDLGYFYTLYYFVKYENRLVDIFGSKDFAIEFVELFKDYFENDKSDIRVLSFLQTLYKHDQYLDFLARFIEFFSYENELEDSDEYGLYLSNLKDNKKHAILEYLNFLKDIQNGD